MWWEDDRENAPEPAKEGIPAWLRSGAREKKDSAPLSIRAISNIMREVSRCKSLLSQNPCPPHGSPIWLCQGMDSRTGVALPPMLNEEGRIASGSDIRSSAASTNVFQVNNTFTTVIGSKQDLLQEQNQPETSRKANVSMRPNRAVSKRKITAPFIPMQPRCVADVLTHWIWGSLTEGLAKPLVLFSKEERNSSSRCRKLFDKRKKIAMAFLVFAQKFGIAEYEKKFVPLFSTRVMNKALVESRAFLKSECDRDGRLLIAMARDENIREITDTANEALNLKKVLKHS